MEIYFFTFTFLKRIVLSDFMATYTFGQQQNKYVLKLKKAT